MLWVTAVLALMSPACDEDESQDASDGTGTFMTNCEDDEVVVTYFGPQEDSEPEDVCAPTPSECAPTGELCGDDACIEALYALCDAPSLGSGCSSIDTSVFVSCAE